MDALTAFGLLSVSAMLVCYALEGRTLVRSGIRGELCARFSVRLPAGRLAVRTSVPLPTLVSLCGRHLLQASEAKGH